jgi:hypothetical protein
LTGDLAKDRARDEGYLYWLAWTAQNTVSLFSTGDAQGNWRRIFLGGLSCNTIAGAISGILPGLGGLPPTLSGLVPQIINQLGTAGVCVS